MRSCEKMANEVNEGMCLGFWLMMSSASIRSRQDRQFRLRRNARQRRLAFFRHQERQRLAFMQLMIQQIDVGQCVERSLWSRERSSAWWENIVMGSFTEQQWLQNFRMRQGTFMYLVTQLSPRIRRVDTNMRRPISCEVRVAVTLWVLANGSSFRCVGQLFGIAKSSVVEIVNETVIEIVLCLKQKYINIPTGERLRDIINGFETRWGFPNCAGAIDGTHIPIKSPAEHHIDYYNRKGYYSLVCQVICDHQYRIWDAVIGWPGRVHDARVFINSPIYEKAEAGTLFPNTLKTVAGIDVPVMLIGDPAYPLRPYLQKPFSENGNLTRHQRQFNYRLSKARMCIENTFGRCKGRWRILQKRIDIETKTVSTVIMACFILNNICEVHREQFDDSWLDAVEAEPDQNGNVPGAMQVGNGNNNATVIRLALVQHFINN